MNCSTTFSMKMESKETATKALEIMKSVLAQTDVDGFEYDSRETFDRFADNLVVKGSEIIDTQSYGLMPETYHIVLPEMFKAVARCFCFGVIVDFISSARKSTMTPPMCGKTMTSTMKRASW